MLYSWSAFCYLFAVETLQLILCRSFSGKPHVLKPLRLPLGEFVLWKKTNFCFGVTLTWRVALQNIWWLLDVFGFRGKFIAKRWKEKQMIRFFDDPVWWCCIRESVALQSFGCYPEMIMWLENFFFPLTRAETTPIRIYARFLIYSFVQKGFLNFLFERGRKTKSFFPPRL